MRRAARGVALPIALILMALLSALVVAQVRRGLTDERLAGNSRQTVSIANAAATLLRYCEFRMIALPLQTVTIPADPAQAAWRVDANWDPARTFTFPGFTVPGVTFNRCLIEDATGELGPAPVDAGGLGSDRGYHKYRITAQVRMSDPTFPGLERPYFLQSELRVNF